MKTNLAIALATAGFLAALPHVSRAQTKAEEEVVTLTGSPSASRPTPPPSAGSGVEFRQWHQGEPPVRLIRKEEGVCALTSVSGGFAGGGEEVHLYIGPDGYWYLGGKSMQHGVAAQCVVVRFPVAAPTPAPAKHVKVLAASYSFGSHYADVTARVKRLLREGETFHADPDWLLVDPEPGWNKVLVIFCKVDGKRAIFSVGEGEPVSRELLSEKARVATGTPPIHPAAGL